MDIQKLFACWIMLLLFATITSCASQKEVASPAEWKGNSIKFGKGGGFTGVSNMYVLLENGQLFSQDGLSSNYTALSKVSKKAAAALFKSAALLSFPAADVNEPGNMYKELQVTLPNKTIKLLWSDGNTTVNSDINNFHQQLLLLIKK